MNVLLRNENDTCTDMEHEMLVNGAATTIEEKICEINFNKKDDKGNDIFISCIFLQ